MKTSTPAKNNFWRRIPLWVYPAVLVVLIFALSLLPGGDDLRILIVPVLGWTATIWVFRQFKAVRMFVYISFAIIAFVILLFATVGSSLNTLHG